jgi:hypothetical protein
MVTSKRFSLVFRSGTGLLLALASASLLFAQVPAKDAPSAQQIYVDDHCQVLDGASGEFRTDTDVCHFDGIGVHRSSHIAAREVDGFRQHFLVNVAEQTYMLQNIHSGPAVFVVAQQVPEGWYVDSDPQPKETKGNVAIFRVTAQPGEIVQLHVGLARESPLSEP